MVTHTHIFNKEFINHRHSTHRHNQAYTDIHIHSHSRYRLVKALSSGTLTSHTGIKQVSHRHHTGTLVTGTLVAGTQSDKI